MSLSLVGTRLNLHKGDSGVLEVQVFTDDTKTVPLNITGHTVNFQVAADFGTAFASAVIKKDNGGLGGVVITDAVNGKYQIQFAASWTSGLGVGEYAYSTKVITPGSSVYTMLAGVFDLKQNVAHA